MQRVVAVLNWLVVHVNRTSHIMYYFLEACYCLFFACQVNVITLNTLRENHAFRHLDPEEK